MFQNPGDHRNGKEDPHEYWLFPEQVLGQIYWVCLGKAPGMAKFTPKDQRYPNLPLRNAAEAKGVVRSNSPAGGTVMLWVDFCTSSIHQQVSPKNNLAPVIWFKKVSVSSRAYHASPTITQRFNVLTALVLYSGCHAATI